MLWPPLFFPHLEVRYANSPDIKIGTSEGTLAPKTKILSYKFRRILAFWSQRFFRRPKWTLIEALGQLLRNNAVNQVVMTKNHR